MSIVRWNPLISTLSRWPDIWDDDEVSFMNRASNNLDVYETEDAVTVKANVAGVPAEKVDITFDNGVLWIQASAEEAEDDREKKHYSKSVWNYSYKVAVPSPGMLDQQQDPDVQIENGVLTVLFKKAESAKPKKLQVKSK